MAVSESLCKDSVQNNGKGILGTYQIRSTSKILHPKMLYLVSLFFSLKKGNMKSVKGLGALYDMLSHVSIFCLGIIFFL